MQENYYFLFLYKSENTNACINERTNEQPELL